VPNKFTRWAVLHAHDRSPVDRCTFIHKAAAMQAKSKTLKPDKFIIARVSITEAPDA
jgi:hypothetical protein